MQLVSLEVRPGAAFETQSGLQANRPRIYGVLAGAARGRTAAVVMHPTSNFMGHYLLEPLAHRGVSLLALNSRYAGSDAVLLMERVIQDLGAGVQWLRQRFEQVLLIGNSGGAALTAFYQSQAENLSVRSTPAGDPVDLCPEDLPPADGIVLAAGHLGRSRLMLSWLDPSVTDEADPMSCNPALDMYEPRNGPPYDEAFLTSYRLAQRARSESITKRVRARLANLRARSVPLQDEAFIVYRTYADPRFMDLSLDANDRRPGGNRGDDPRAVNYAVQSLARYTSLTAWLSQWSLDSHADGPAHLARTSCPVLQLEYTADGSVFPSDIETWSRACVGREERHALKPGTHYLRGQPELVARAADLISDWARRN